MYYSTNRLKGEESICNKAVNFPERTLRRAGAAMSVRQRRPLPHMTAPRPVWFRVLSHPLYKCPFFVIIVPSDDKGKHACQRVFPALLALFALACASLAPREHRSAASARICRLSKPAAQKPKITRKYIAGRCGAVLPEQKCVQTRKDPQRILAVLSRGLTQYGHISARQNRVCPCQAMVLS